jgi:hypothetical protein
MAHLQTDGAQVFSRWHNDGMTGYRKRPRDPAQLVAVFDGAALAAASADPDFSRLAPRAVRAAVFLDFFTG